MTTVFDAGGEGSAKACWALMRRARADRFESANSAAIPSPFQGLVFPRPKKPDRYWSAPRDAKRPAISVVEIGYVRRSESRVIRSRPAAGGAVPGRAPRARICASIAPFPAEPKG